LIAKLKNWLRHIPGDWLQELEAEADQEAKESQGELQHPSEIMLDLETQGLLETQEVQHKHTSLGSVELRKTNGSTKSRRSSSRSRKSQNSESRRKRSHSKSRASRSPLKSRRTQSPSRPRGSGRPRGKRSRVRGALSPSRSIRTQSPSRSRGTRRSKSRDQPQGHSSDQGVWKRLSPIPRNPCINQVSSQAPVGVPTVLGEGAINPNLVLPDGHEPRFAKLTLNSKDDTSVKNRLLRLVKEQYREDAEKDSPVFGQKKSHAAENKSEESQSPAKGTEKGKNKKRQNKKGRVRPCTEVGGTAGMVDGSEHNMDKQAREEPAGEEAELRLQQEQQTTKLLRLQQIEANVDLNIRILDQDLDFDAAFKMATERRLV